MKSLDVYAITNPAFGSLVLRSFATGFCGRQPQGVEFPLLFLPLPIILSKSISSAFDGTNVRTGLLPWLARHPEVLVGFGDRVCNSREFSREAVAFGLRYQALQVTDGGLTIPSSVGLRREPAYPASDERGRALALADRLGAWMSEVNSTKIVYHSFGIMP